MDDTRTTALISTYGLCAHPEGGYYKEIYRSRNTLFSPVHSKRRAAVTHIYFLLTQGQVSRFHRVLHDEIWNFYQGAPLRLLCYDGEQCREEQIGPDKTDFCAVVPGGIYQAAESTGDYSFVGCTVAPGFDFDDFSFLSDDTKAANAFLRRHPGYDRFL